MLRIMKWNVAAVLLLSLVSVQAWSAININAGMLLKGAAIGYAVKQTGPQLNHFINTITLRNHMQTKMATKVVPILSVGEKGYIGGAQVSGPAVLIKKVQAVFQYEKNLSNNNYRVKVLVPSASLNPLALSRVPKTGVTAIIDVSLDGSLKNGTIGTGISITDAAKVAGLLVLIHNVGPTINKGINFLTLNKGQATKFVPWGSIGDKTYFGGAQVSASATTIKSVKAVWQYDGLFGNGAFRVKVMVPTNNTNPLKIKRVDGAGITAVVDMALSPQKVPVLNKTPIRNYRSTNATNYGTAANPVYRTTSGSYVDKYGNIVDKNGNIITRKDDGKDNGKHKGWTKGKGNQRKNEHGRQHGR